MDSGHRIASLKRLRQGAVRAAVATIRLFPESSAWRARLSRGFHWMTFFYRHGRPPQVSPSSFNDFLYTRKTDGSLRHPLKRRVTDKEHGKQYIDSRIGTGWTVETIAVLDSHAAIGQFHPAEFPIVVKPTHSSGRVRVIHDPAEYRAALPHMRRWLDHNYFAQTLEENYVGLARKVIVEPYLDRDFFLEGSLHCRLGQVRIISLIDRFDAGKRRASLDRNWQPLDVALGQPYRPMELPPLPFLELLVDKAEAVANEFDYIRVDFYASNERFLFGELTNLPGGGLSRFSSEAGRQRFEQAFFGPALSGKGGHGC